MTVLPNGGYFVQDLVSAVWAEVISPHISSLRINFTFPASDLRCTSSKVKFHSLYRKVIGVRSIFFEQLENICSKRVVMCRNTSHDSKRSRDTPAHACLDPLFVVHNPEALFNIQKSRIKIAVRLLGPRCKCKLYIIFILDCFATRSAHRKRFAAVHVLNPLNKFYTAKRKISNCGQSQDIVENIISYLTDGWKLLNKYSGQNFLHSSLSE